MKLNIKIQILILLFSSIFIACQNEKSNHNEPEINNEIIDVQEETQEIENEELDTIKPIIEEKDTVERNTTYNSKPARLISDIEAYKNHIEKNPKHKLIRLADHNSKIKLVPRYYGTNNIFDRSLYNMPEVFICIQIAESLSAINQELEEDGYRLIVWDAYRPYSVTVEMWEHIRNPRYAATPQKGSRHNRGMAVDVSIEKLDGTKVEMPTDFDDLSREASPLYHGISHEARQNRDYLIAKMQKHGFTVLSSEWWHFDYKGWSYVPLFDISFEDLLRIEKEQYLKISKKIK